MSNILQFIPKSPICNICDKPVDPEIAVADQDGKRVHEECYVLNMRLRDAKGPPKDQQRTAGKNAKSPFLVLNRASGHAPRWRGGQGGGTGR